MPRRRKTPISNRGRWSSLSLFRQIHLGVRNSNLQSGLVGQSWPVMESYEPPFPTSHLPCMLPARHQGKSKLCFFPMSVNNSTYVGSTSWKQLRSRRGTLAMMMMNGDLWLPDTRSQTPAVYNKVFVLYHIRDIPELVFFTKSVGCMLPTFRLRLFLFSKGRRRRRRAVLDCMH